MTGMTTISEELASALTRQPLLMLAIAIVNFHLIDWSLKLYWDLGFNFASSLESLGASIAIRLTTAASTTLSCLLSPFCGLAC